MTTYNKVLLKDGIGNVIRLLKEYGAERHVVSIDGRYVTIDNIVRNLEKVKEICNEETGGI